MYNEVITLNLIDASQDLSGDEDKISSKTEVFCRVKSVGMREKYKGKQVGIEPELIFVLADYYDYSGETELEYDGLKYSVIRTYKNDENEMEIVCSRTGNGLNKNLNTAEISSTSEAFDKLDQKDVVVSVSNSAPNAIALSGQLVEAGNYIIKYQSITFKAAYLDTLSMGPHVFTILTDSNNLYLTITVN